MKVQHTNEEKGKKIEITLKYDYNQL